MEGRKRLVSRGTRALRPAYPSPRALAPPQTLSPSGTLLWVHAQPYPSRPALSTPHVHAPDSEAPRAACAVDPPLAGAATMPSGYGSVGLWVGAG